jgi:hypothetical protein
MIGALMSVEPGPTFVDVALERVFRRDGWVVVDLLEATEVAGLARVFASIAGVPEEPIYSSWSQALDVRAATDEAIRSVTLPRLRVLLPEWAMVFAGFMAKAVGPATAFPIHQDPTVVDEGRWTPLTFWVPLVEVGPETGCMQAIPGSHRLDASPRPAFRPFPHQHEDARLRPLLRTIPMRAGQVMLSHPALFHASTPNRGAARRVACVGIVVPGDAEVRYYRRREDEPVIDVHPVPPGFYVRACPQDSADGLPITLHVPDRPPPLDLDALVALGTGAAE